MQAAVDEPVCAQLPLMRPVEGRSTLAIAVIGTEPAEVDFAALGRAEIAELAAEHGAAVADEPRRDRGVVVRREIQVIRQDQVVAGVVRIAERRHQQAAGPAVVDREARIRQVHHRHVAQPQGDLAGAADAGFLVQVDAAGAQLPVRIVRIATGERGRGQRAGLAVGRERGGVGPTVAAAVAQLEAHVGEFAVAFLEPGRACRTRQHARCLEAHRAGAVHTAFGSVVVEAVAPQPLVGAVHDHVAVESILVLAEHLHRAGADFGIGDGTLFGREGRGGGRREQRRRAGRARRGQGTGGRRGRRERRGRENQRNKDGAAHTNPTKRRVSLPVQRRSPQRNRSPT